MEKFVRICPQCGKDIEHKTKASMKDAIRRNQLCRKCGCNKPERLSIQREINSGERNPFFGKKHSEETKKHWSASKKGKMPELLLERIRSGICANKGIKNGMYGKSVYSVWLQKFGKEEADRRKLEMENKKRETFKKNYNPSKHKSPPYGCGNGWGGWYKNWYFRSLRELSYMIKVIEKDGLSWESGESWQNCIIYTDEFGQERRYFPDFIINGMIMVEIKPKKLKLIPQNLLKQKSAEDFCKTHNLSYEVVDPEVLSWEEVFELHKNHKIIFSKTTEIKFQSLLKRKTRNETE